MKTIKKFAAAAILLVSMTFAGCADGHTTVHVGVGVGYPYGWGGMGVYGMGGGGVHYGGYWR